MRRGQRRGELVEPIARWAPGGDDGQRLLLDPTAMRIHFRIDERTVRRYDPVACDTTTRAPLYDEGEVSEQRQKTPRRRRPTAA